MGPISESVVIDQPRERVFDFLTDLANRESFTDHFVHEYRLERLPSVGVGAAARFCVDPPGPGDTMWIETVIEEAERPHRIYERGRGGRWDRIPVFTVWELVAGPRGATEATLTFWTEPANAADRLRERLGATRGYRRRWGRALRRLKEILETDAAIEPVRVAGESRLPV